MIDSTGKSWRTGHRESDYSQLMLPAPSDKALDDVGMMRHFGDTFVVLRHRITGSHYARNLATNQMMRVYLDS